MYRIRRVISLLCITASGLGQLMAQTHSIYKNRSIVTILDDENNQISQLPVSITLLDTAYQSTTNEDGELVILSTRKIDSARLSIDPKFGELPNHEVYPLKNKGTITLRILSHFKKVNPISITASVNPRLATDNPYSVRVIDKQTIQKMAAQNVTEVLQNQSAVIINQDPSLGSSVQLQGLGGQNVKFLINGVPMIGRLNGNIDVSQIPTESIERIEIVEGPMSIVYGTDAIGGVINIITKTPTKNSSQTGLTLFADGVGNYNQDVQFTQFLCSTADQHIALKLNAGRQFFRGFDFDRNTRQFDWKPKSRLYGNAQLLYTNKKLRQSVRYSDYYEFLIDRSDAEFNLVTVTGYNNYFHTRRRDLSAVTEFRYSPTHSFRFQNALNHYRREKFNVRRNLVTGTEIPTRSEDQDKTLNIAFNFRGLWEYRSLSKKFTSLVGYEMQQESLTTQRLTAKDPLLDAAIFTSLEYSPIPRFTVKPSARIAYNRTFGTNPLPGITGPSLKMAPIIPSIQLKGDLSKHSTFRASYAQGFRAPTAKELYFLFVDINHNVQGNPNLRSERSDNINISIDYRHAITSKVAATFKVSSFYNDIRDQIQLSLLNLSTNLYRYINIGEMRSMGLNAQTKVYYDRFELLTSVSYISNESKVDGVSDAQTWNVYQGTANLSYRFNLNRTQIQWFSRYTGRTIGFYSTGLTYEISDYYLADLNISHEFSRKVQLQMGVKNLFNVGQIQNTAPITGVHSSNGSGLNIAMGRNLFVRCVINL
ncbi:MAG: TonB-dependent receptor plug domain-containing protein [Bacteroidia bacterium]